MGGLGTRVRELSLALSATGFETHLYFLGDPTLPPEEGVPGTSLQLHRCCRHLLRAHPGVYTAEPAKCAALARFLPGELAALARRVADSGRRLLVLAEEWQTAAAVLRTRRLLPPSAGVLLTWNANSLYGVEEVPWGALAAAAVLLTVSRWMRYRLEARGVTPAVVPNGIPARLLESPPPPAPELRAALGPRPLYVKVGRATAEKGWEPAIEALAQLRRRGEHPLLVARCGAQLDQGRVLAAAAHAGLRLATLPPPYPTGPRAWGALLAAHAHAEVLYLSGMLPEETRQLLFAAADAVLAQSSFEPFGLVGLEAMAAGAVVVTGCTGEDYVQPFRNAVPVEGASGRELAAVLARLQADPLLTHQLRQAGRATAAAYTWPRVLRLLLLRLEALEAVSAPAAGR